MIEFEVGLICFRAAFGLQKGSVSSNRVFPASDTLWLVWSFVRIEESAWTVCLRVPLCVVRSVGLDRCVITCTHREKIAQNSLTALKIPCAVLVPPSFPPNPQQPLVFLLALESPLFRSALQLGSDAQTPCSLSHLAVYI